MNFYVLHYFLLTTVARHIAYLVAECFDIDKSSVFMCIKGSKNGV